MSGWCYAQGTGNSGNMIVVKKSYLVDGNNIPLRIEYIPTLVTENGKKYLICKATNESNTKRELTITFKLYDGSGSFLFNCHTSCQGTLYPDVTKEFKIHIVNDRAVSFQLDDVTKPQW